MVNFSFMLCLYIFTILTKRTLVYINARQVLFCFHDFTIIISQEAVKWFSNEPYISPGGIGACGVSFGGTIAQLMASRFPDKVGISCSTSFDLKKTSLNLNFYLLLLVVSNHRYFSLLLGYSRSTHIKPYCNDQAFAKI